MKQTTLLFLCCLLSVFRLSAAPVVVKGHAYPRDVTAQGVDWTLKGTQHFTVRLLVKFSVFTGAYYEQTDGEGKRLKFTYTRDVKSEDLTERAMETLEEQNTEKELQARKELLQKIQSAFADVKEGDSYTITAIPGKGTWLHLNDKEVFTAEDGEFGLWYLNIWLGAPPIDEGLKAALTGGNGL